MWRSMLLALFLLAVTACAPAAQQVIVVTATPPPRPVCQPADFYLETRRALAKFKDIETRAGVTARMNLSPVVGELQDMRRAYEAISAPDCVTDTKGFVLDYMNHTIEAYLQFMRGKDYETLSSKESTLAAAYLAKAEDSLQQVGYLLGTPHPPEPVVSETSAVLDMDSSLTLKPETVTVVSGKPVLFTFRNRGIADHRLVSAELGIAETIPARQTVAKTYTFPKPGEYQLICATPGHLEAGEKITIVVR